MSDYDTQVAIRARASGLLVATTAPISMSVVAAGGDRGASAYVRAAGSFLTDRIHVGMEVLAANCTVPENNGYSTVLAISADKRILTVDRKLLDEPASGGKSLTVGLPSLVSWENVTFEQAKAVGRPFVDEQYLPGPAYQHTAGQGGLINVEPMAIYTFYVRRGVDIAADSLYVDAMRVLFAPGTPIVLPNQPQPLVVRRDVAPAKSQRQFAVEGWAAAPFAIPMRIQTPNSI